MVTVHREAGLSVVIFLEDHEPAHVHIFGDGEAKINLATDGGAPELVWHVGMSFAELRRARKIVKTQQAFLLEKWAEIHG